jgi:phosphohistidine phosphatase SixA
VSGDPAPPPPADGVGARVDPAAVYLVRHAKAADREVWTEADQLRPLTKRGRRQAEGLTQMFRRLDVSRVVTSSYLRCMQTVRPLALARGVAVELSAALEEGAPIEDALRLVTATPDGSILCSHGDVIPAVVDRLAAAGMTIDGDVGWKKGSTWILERRGDGFVRARYAPPPTFD